MRAQCTLTIGIPTFNSRDYLKECIDVVMSQIKFNNHVELLICDNCSDDGTQDLVSEYVQRFSDHIRYVRHKSNLGMDKNFWSVVENSNGEFVHLLADDDFYMPNGVERILDVINRYSNLDAILLSNNYLNTRNGRIIQNKELCGEDVFCDASGEKFFLNESLKTLCLSNVVVRKSSCLEIANIEKYFGCQWLHVAILTQIVKPLSNTYIFNFKQPVVTVRIGNQKWLEAEGSVSFYYKLLSVFQGLKSAGYNGQIFEHIKAILLPIVLNGGRLKYDKIYLNILYCLRFFKFYYNMPKHYALFCLKLIFQKRRPFFEGWENVGQ